jgi:hypothetical protein
MSNADTTKSGIVVYRRKGTTLEGQWSHVRIDGKLAKEVVSDVPIGAYEGDWPVKVYMPDGQLQFTGRLRSTRLGDCLKLTWLGPDGNAAFQGLGQHIDGELMAASFEEISSKTSG